MKFEEFATKLATPITAPPYPLPPYYFKDREFLNIVYRTDYEALRKAVPEPLELDKEKPYVKFEVINMPDVSGLGSYMESGQVIPVTYDGEEGDYISSMYVNNYPAIASGRELSAYPKKLGSPDMYIDNDVLVGTLDYGTLRVATATMGYKHKKYDPELARQEITRPMYMLKMALNYNGQYEHCDLTKSQITSITIKEAWQGPARLQLFDHVLAPLADLPVLEIISATHIIADLELNPVHPIYNYLTKESYNK